MSYLRLRRYLPALLGASLLVPLFVAGGCRSGDELSSRLDAASLARLESLPAEDVVLAACRFASLADSLPVLGDAGRELGRTSRAVLVEVPRAELARLAALDGAETIAVWGGGGALKKLDHQLRKQLLNAWGENDPAELEMVGSFDQDHLEGLRERLEAAGARPRTVAGTVVTVDASPEVILEILAMPDLVRLQKPRTLKLLDGQ